MIGAGLARLRQRLWAPVPAAVRDQLALLRYDSLRAQVPMLYAMLILLILVTLWGTPAPANPLIAWALPTVMMGVISIRLFIWHRRRHTSVTPAMATRMVRTMTQSSCAIGLVASLWCITSWVAAPPHLALYYPMLLTMGSLSAAYCVSNVRSETIINLAIGLFPISAMMITTGQTMDIAAGASILIAAIFLMRLIIRQHDRLITQLLLEQRMWNLANTDELTGLINRRALKQEMTQLIEGGQPLALILLDLDGFKAVNDQYGHGAGDTLLQEISARLSAAAAQQASVARLGGDEFALLLPGGDRPQARALADRVLLTLVRPITLATATVRIGASAGIAAAHGDTSINALFAEADGALYAAKRGPHPSLDRTLNRRASRPAG